MRAWIALLFIGLALAGCTQPEERVIPIEEAEEEGIPMDEDGGIDLAFYGVNGDPFLGNDSAAVQVIAYDAPGCPNCKRYHTNHLPGIIEDYADTGRIGYHFLQYRVGYPYDIWGGVAAECAHREGGVHAYKLVIDRLFEHQRDTPRIPEWLDEAAAAFDLDADVLRACYDNEETRDEVDADIQAGAESKAGSNPGFAVVGPSGVELVKGSSGPRDAIERALASI